MSIKGIPNYEYFNVTTPAEYVAYVEINRPKKLNAFCNAMWYEMKDIFTRLSTHPDVRAVLLCSAGERAFTAGLDVQQASESGAISGAGFSDPSRKAFSIRRHVFDLQDCVTTLADCEKPVIALCHGITYGLGQLLPGFINNASRLTSFHRHRPRYCLRYQAMFRKHQVLCKGG